MNFPWYYWVMACVVAVTVCENILNPVILVPGDGGNQLLAKLNKPTVVISYCTQKTKDYIHLWLTVEIIVANIKCLMDNMRLVYDNTTRTTSNSPGVDVIVPGFGDTTTLEWLDHSQIAVSSYFHKIVYSLINLGYRRNVTIRGAPYDFRRAPNELQDYFQRLQSLIEETYYQNNRKVVLVGHSMGNPMVLYLLNRMTISWKDKFIKSFVSIAGVWGGAAKPVKLMISGENFNLPFVSPLTFRRGERSLPSTAWLMPSEDFWQPDEVLVVAPSKNYTVKDYKQLFLDINYPTGYMMWEDTNQLLQPLVAPGVEMHCLHGVNVQTPGMFVYTGHPWYEKSPKTIDDNGDGTVNIRSLLGCLRFKDQQKQPVYHKTFNKVEHQNILKDNGVISYLKVVLSHDSDSLADYRVI